MAVGMSRRIDVRGRVERRAVVRKGFSGEMGEGVVVCCGSEVKLGFRWHVSGGLGLGSEGC